MNDFFTIHGMGSAAKTVGKREAPSQKISFSSASDSKEKVINWRRALPTPMVPRGVYRFTSHEEADAWLWTQISRRTRP